MIKISNKVKKMLALMLLILTIFSTAQPVFAASGTGKFVGGQYDSGMKTTDNQNTDKGVMIRRLINYSTGEKMTTFCAEYSVNFKTGVIYNGEYYTPTDNKVKKACKVAYFGWYSKYPDYVIDGGILAADMKWIKQEYVFTQQFIWETLGQSNATFTDATVQNQYIAFKNDINNKIDNMEKKPSFCDTTITVDIGQSITLTDTNCVLEDYASIDITSEGIRFVHNKGENTMTITVSKDCTLENYTISEEMMKNWGVIKDESKENDTTIFFSFENEVQDQFYAMHYNDPVTMSMNLQINLFGNIELSKLDKDGKLVDGAIFEINGPNNFSKDVIVTNGKITIDKLRKGTYTIKEKTAPNGYLLNTNTYTVEVLANQITTQAIVNETPTGTFTLVKKNEDSSANLEGTKYRIWNNNGYDKEFVTDKDGKIIVTGLVLGTYNYKEIQATNGYLLDTNTYLFELKYKDQNTSVIYENVERTNTEPTGIITITKEDSETGSVSQGDANLENAVYKVYANEDIYNVAKTKKFYSKGDLVATRTTNSKGETENVTNLPLGKYLIKEDKAPTGYMIDKTEYEVNLTYKDQNTKIITGNVTSIDKVKEMQVHIYKTAIKENAGLAAGLEGAEFTIKLYSDIEKAYKQGYSYEEIWNGLDKYGNIVKLDSKRIEEAQKIAPTYEKIITNTNGDAYTQEKLPYGKYVVKETKVPQNFMSAEDFTFSITQDESEIQEIAQKVKHLVVNNEQLQTYIKLIKKDLITGKKVTLSSSTFEIKATEDIRDVTTGEIIYPKGKAITQKIGNTTYSSFTTNANNIVIPDNSYNTKNDDKGSVTTPLLLPAGNYEVTEIRVPEGFVQLQQPIVFKIENIKDFKRDKDGECIKEVVIENEQPKGTLIVNKNISIRKNVDTSLINISDLSGIQFRLKAKDDVIDFADGSVIYKKGQEVNIYNLDTNGNLKVENLPMGTYELQEVKTLEGLVLDNTKYEVKFSQKDQVTKVYTERKEITNDSTITEISKTDITGEKQLIGAKLTITDENNKVIDTWISTDKIHKIEGLIVGKIYTLSEELAPAPYVKATEVKFTIDDTGEIQTVKMVDKVVLVSKKDSVTGEELSGAELVVTDKDGNVIDKWVTTDELHYVTGLEEGQEYTLTEIRSPDGYEIAQSVNFTVTTDKEAQLVEMKDMPIIPLIQTGNKRNYIVLIGSIIVSLLGLIFLKRKDILNN